MNYWYLLGVVAIAGLVYFWNKRGAVWGGLTLGIVGGILVALYFLITGDRFDWQLLVKGGVVGTLCGLAAEIPQLVKRK